MFKLIKNINIYAPKFIGKKDILICCNRIIKISENIEFPVKDYDIKIIDGTDFIAVPGFIDQHVHFIGGGGEGGPITRTPEIKLENLTIAGITTALGLLGADGITRHMSSLLAKARALDMEGITTYIYSGCYTIPTQTLTGSVSTDIIYIDKIIGAGEIAISDHRSSQPSLEDLRKLAAEARIGGLLAGKAGIVHIHIGDSLEGIKLIMEIVRNSEIPIKQFMPTHINREDHLVEQSMKYLKMGGFVDLTSSFSRTEESLNTLSIADTLKIYKENKMPIDRVCASSDSNGSIPFFDSEGNILKIEIGTTIPFWGDIKQAIIQDIVNLEEGISLITQNPAKALKLYPKKGTITEGNDADLVLLDKSLNINTVIAKGQVMVKDGNPIIKGFFER